ncbi:MAG: DNA cytosine methyltransferase [Bacteroidales bacterium]|nr:DNA cytosine methyltransferase [Bacteroidales bacterium]
MKNPQIISYTRDRKGKIQNYHTKAVANTLHSSTGSGGNTDQYVINATTDGNANCIHAGYYKVSQANIVKHNDDGYKATGIVDGCRVRKLTERECFRLMGVADKDIDTIQATGISKTQQYKLAGNSIVVDVLYHIFCQAFTRPNPNQINMATQKQLKALAEGRKKLASKRKSSPKTARKGSKVVATKSRSRVAKNALNGAKTHPKKLSNRKPKGLSGISDARIKKAIALIEKAKEKLDAYGTNLQKNGKVIPSDVCIAHNALLTSLVFLED